MWQELKKGKVQSEAPRYNLNNSTSSNQQKTTLPLKTKTKCKKCTQKEVAVKNVEIMPNLLVNHESHQERPPKSVLEPPEWLRHDLTYVECLNHLK